MIEKTDYIYKNEGQTNKFQIIFYRSVSKYG